MHGMSLNNLMRLAWGPEDYCPLTDGRRLGRILFFSSFLGGRNEWDEHYRYVIYVGSI